MKDMEESAVVTKTQFAALVGVSRARVAQWISGGKIFGAALVGEGRHARVRVSVACDQLKRNLDLDQRLGANGKAKLDASALTASDGSAAVVPDRIEDEIKRARRDQLELANEKAREEQAARAGRYISSDDARREMGRIAGRMTTMFEGALGEFAMAIAAQSNLPARDVLHTLRQTFHAIRTRESDTEAEAAAALPPLLDDDAAQVTP